MARWYQNLAKVAGTWSKTVQEAAVRRGKITPEELVPPYWPEVGVAAFVALFVVAGTWLVFGDTLGEQAVRDHAERYAISHGSRIDGMRLPVAECSGIDSDANGYVTCTLRDADRDFGSPVPKHVECVSNVFFEWNTGCRDYRPLY